MVESLRTDRKTKYEQPLGSSNNFTEDFNNSLGGVVEILIAKHHNNCLGPTGCSAVVENQPFQ